MKIDKSYIKEMFIEEYVKDTGEQPTDTEFNSWLKEWVDKEFKE